MIRRCLLEVKAFYEKMLNVKSVVGPRRLHLDDSSSTRDGEPVALDHVDCDLLDQSMPVCGWIFGGCVLIKIGDDGFGLSECL